MLQGDLLDIRDAFEKSKLASIKQGVEMSTRAYITDQSKKGRHIFDLGPPTPRLDQVQGEKTVP